jgi:methionine synthase II (cobalamin-independent)
MMNSDFHGNALPFLIGSLPLSDHEAAARLVWEYTPQIPLWVQLPRLPGEGMIAQFAPGLPGLRVENGKHVVDTAAEGFDAELLRFYEDYLAVNEGGAGLEGSRFGLGPDAIKGLFVLLAHLKEGRTPPHAVKGQVTGPFTLGTGVIDGRGRAVFFDPQLRDVVVKLLVGRARWQVRQLSAFGRPVILSIDEPVLTGFGSSEYISVSREDIAASLAEVIDAVHVEGGLAAIHVCGNTDWALILDSAADIVSFDAFAYFDRFFLYRSELKRFLDAGRILAWGIVPTLSPDDLARHGVESLTALLTSQAERVLSLGLSKAQLLAQSLISPACGMGSLTAELALKALELTREVAERFRQT